MLNFRTKETLLLKLMILEVVYFDQKAIDLMTNYYQHQALVNVVIFLFRRCLVKEISKNS
jgi:hypothetical protein